MPKLVSPIGISMLKIVLSTPLSPSWNFRYVFTLPFLEISQENKLSPLEILENYVTLLGNSKVKHKDPLEIPHDFLLNTSGPGKSASFLVDPWNLYLLLQ